MNGPAPEDRVSFSELLGYWGVGKSYLHEQVKAGALESFKVAGKRYFSLTAVVRFELERGRFNCRPAEKERVAGEAGERLRNYLRAARGRSPDETAGGEFARLVHRVERLEKLLGAQTSSQEAA